MTFDTLTREDAKRIFDALQDLEVFTEKQNKAEYDSKMAQALVWFNTLGINLDSARTREKTLENYNTINQLMKSETDRYKRKMLSQKLKRANQRFKEVKKIG